METEIDVPDCLTFVCIMLIATNQEILAQNYTFIAGLNVMYQLCTRLLHNTQYGDFFFSKHKDRRACAIVVNDFSSMNLSVRK